MKKIFGSLITMSALVASFLLCGCATYFTQEMKEGVSFEGLTKVYVEPARGGAEVFSLYGMTATVNSEVAEQMKNWFKENGFAVVDDAKDAQIIFRPIWNVSYESPSEWNYNSANVLTETTGLPYGESHTRPYALLEVQAWFPNRDEWVWRGFSPVKATSNMFTAAAVRGQVNWCMQHFPPEKFPSAIEIYREKKAEQQKAKENNPFENVKVEGKWNPETKKVEPISASAEK